jgi:hypothetical protein
MDLYSDFMKNFDNAANQEGLGGTDLAKARRSFSNLKEEGTKNDRKPKDFLKNGVTMKQITKLAQSKKSANSIKNEIQKLLGDGEDVKEFLNCVKKDYLKSKKETKEAMGTGAGGGSFEPAISFGETKKVETKEGTSTASSGSYETNKMWAKSMSKKHWRNAGANYMPGAKRVQVKKKCTRFPYCNQGDINALNIFENEVGQKVIKNISEELGVSEQYIKNIINREIN